MDRLVLISLLVKLGVAAAVASTLARSREFQSLLYREERTLKQKIYLTIWIAIPFALGIVVRVVTPRFIAADLSFEAVMLIGVIGGRFAGALGGILIAVPAAIHGELLSLPLNVLCGLIAGTLRDAATEREMIWSFSPFVDLSLYRWVRKVLPRPKIDWQISFFLVIIGLEFLRMELARSRWFHSYIFAVDSSNIWIKIAIFATVLMCIGIPLKIWNNTRIELKLEQQERLLMQARMEALQSQINPHFLFNTLNSVSSLVRFDPDTARELIVKLANILRRLAAEDGRVCSAERRDSVYRRLPGYRSRTLRTRQTQGHQRTRPALLRHDGAEHAAAAARREFDQAWVEPKDRRRRNPVEKRRASQAADHRSGRRWGGHGGRDS